MQCCGSTLVTSRSGSSILVQCGSRSGSGSGYGSRVLIKKNLKKVTTETIEYFLNQKLQFTYP
jgi:hypothetical protein